MRAGLQLFLEPNGVSIKDSLLLHIGMSGDMCIMGGDQKFYYVGSEVVC
jgi:hypothetical protein